MKAWVLSPVLLGTQCAVPARPSGQRRRLPPCPPTAGRKLELSRAGWPDGTHWAADLRLRQGWAAIYGVDLQFPHLKNGITCLLGRVEALQDC